MSCIGILAEDHSDIDALKEIIGKISTKKFKIKPYSGDGCSKLRRKCGEVASRFIKEGAIKIVICHDLDSESPKKCVELRDNIVEKVKKIKDHHDVICIVIPVQELEGWLLADTDAINATFHGMKMKEIHVPSKIESPKEYIRRHSRGDNCKPRYINSVHNQKIFKSADIDKIYSKCPDFRPFYDFIRSL